MNTMNPSITTTMTRPGSGITFGMPASGAYAMLPCAFADSVIDGPTRKRHVDVATERNQGTLVWSPPT